MRTAPTDILSTSGLLTRLRSHRDDVRGRRELARALTGHYGPGVQSDVLAALARRR